MGSRVLNPPTSGPAKRGKLVPNESRDLMPGRQIGIINWIVGDLALLLCLHEKAFRMRDIKYVPNLAEPRVSQCDTF